MIKTLSILALTLFIIRFGTAQQLDTFDIVLLSELNFDINKKQVDSKYLPKGKFGGAVPMTKFLQKYHLKLYIERENDERLLLKTVLKSKEKWESPLDQRVEVKITILDSIRRELMTNGFVTNYSISGDFEKKEGGILHPIHEFNLSYPPQDTIQFPTFKMDSPILIGSPEELTIPIILEYINDNLTSQDSFGGFARTVETLKQFDNDFFYGAFLGSINPSKLMDFYSLLEFLEPYAIDSSFLNLEANKLKKKILTLEGLIENPNSKDSIQNIKEKLSFSKEIYDYYMQEYQIIKGLYEKLWLTLFLTTPRQNYDFGNSRADYEYIILGQKRTHELFGILSNQFFRKNSSVNFIVGTGFSYGTEEIFDITLSPIDTTVNFQVLSRINSTLSAGILWNPFSIRLDSLNKLSLSFGLFLNYHVAPIINQQNLGSSLGIGSGIGIKRKNLSILANIGFRNIRTPKQFFIDNFRETGQKGPFPLDINDDSFFFTKAYTTLGLSLFLTLPQKFSG